MNKFQLLVFIITFCVANMLQAAEQANNTLDQFYQRTQSMQADFQQTIHSTQGKALEQSQGQLIFSRPDKFILEYKTPAEQKYISNGQNIWIYDVELEQVSIKSIDEGIGDSPALLLSGNSNVYKYYQVDDVIVGNSDDYQWVQLVAREPEMTFERVLLAFKDNTLMQMRMYDSFGQITELKFANTQINKPFSNRQFYFVAPEGVDVIGTAGAQ
ncbi:MAG: outer membrane lipoprotein chaperone LolA [Gammaproteobacteria bacterium]|nr:outer membrane lipoprotein chaperone LolA [Gammaproteobacteria bacterium]